MRKMFYNLMRAKQAKALMLYFCEDTDKKKRLKIAEFAVLRALAERMAHKTLKPKGRRTPTIAHTCFPSLESIARDAAMSESTASRAVDGLVKKGLIEKQVIDNWVWKGRSDRTPKHNGVRYRVTPIWDTVPVVEYGDGHEEDVDEQEESTEVSAEELAETNRVLADDADQPVATKRTDSVEPTKEQVDEVIESIKYYFSYHNTICNQSDKDVRRSVARTAKDLAQRALELGDLNYAGNFLWWLINRRCSAYGYLMSDKVKNLCVHFGLPKFVEEFWDQFVPEKDDRITPDDDPNGGDNTPDDNDLEGNDADDFESASAASAPTSAPPPEPPAKSFTYEREAFVSELRKKTELLRRPSEAFTIKLDPEKGLPVGWVSNWLDSVPYGQQIKHERLGNSNKSLLRVEIKWSVARYIVEHAEQFIEDGYVDEFYRPVIDAAVQAEIEAEKKATEERERELARKQKEEAEAAELQRKKDAEVAAVEKEKKRIAFECRFILCEFTNEDGEFHWPSQKPEHVPLVRKYLTKTFPDMFAVTYESKSVLQGTVSSPLLDAMKADPRGFRETGKMEMAADREYAAVLA